MCFKAQSHTKDIAKVCYCTTPLTIKINVKVFANMQYSLYMWSMVLVCIVQVVKRQFMFQLFVHMFVFHNYLPHRRKSSREYSLILCVSAYATI